MKARQAGRWPMGIPGTVQASADTIDAGRFTFLAVYADQFPALLEELAASKGEADALDAWAARWWLTVPWARAYADATLAEWREHPSLRGRTWSDRNDVGCGWVAEGDRVVGPAYWRDADAFRWLARYQSGTSIAELVHESSMSAQRIHDAVRRLAAWLELPLRPAQRGRPRRQIGA